MRAILMRFTRQLQECRRRWNRHSLDYVMGSGRILKRARAFCRDKRTWVRWLREDAHLHTATAYRHIRVDDFLSQSFALKRNFASLSLAKVYALSRTRPMVARRLVHDERVRSMTDVEFARHIRPYLPVSKRGPTTPNLFRSIMAGLERVKVAIERWKGSGRAIPGEFRMKIQLRLRELLVAATHLMKTRREAL
jgi:hypothetical protein